MIAHFGQPVVFASYVLAISASFFLFWMPEVMVVTLLIGMSVALMAVDYLAHLSAHNWKLLRYPIETTLWIVVVFLALIFGLITKELQVVVIFLSQGLWDNSWHAMHNHRAKKGKHKAELDQPIFRWGVAALAALVIFIPSLLE